MHNRYTNLTVHMVSITVSVTSETIYVTTLLMKIKKMVLRQNLPIAPRSNNVPIRKIVGAFLYLFE